jgi:uncharacterized repeat protein (TIGR03843 family)
LSDVAAPEPAAAGRAGGLDAAQVRDILAHGEFEVGGRLTNASNATLFGRVTLDGVALDCVHKPVAGERPLWDFPDGTLAGREVAAYEVSEATGWRVVPPTVMREARWGPGMCQLWIAGAEEDVADRVDSGDSGDAPDAADGETDEDRDGFDGVDGFDDEPETWAGLGPLLTLLPEGADFAGWCPILGVELEDGRPAVLAHREDDRLRRITAFDAVVNNADRKGGHLLVGAAEPEHVYGIDHGVTFHVEDKLRTLLWGFRDEPLAEEIREVLAKLDADLASGALAGRLGVLITRGEIAATRQRVRDLLRAGRYPGPQGRARPVPWPPI